MTNLTGFQLPAGIDVELGHTIVRDPYTDSLATQFITNRLPVAEAHVVLEALGLTEPERA